MNLFISFVVTCILYTAGISNIESVLCNDKEVEMVKKRELTMLNVSY